MNRPSTSRWQGGGLRLGAALTGGYGWLDTATLGPAMHVEWRPSERSFIALYAGIAYLRTREIRLASTDVALTRSHGLLAAKVDTPLPLLHVLVGAEVGRLDASASSSSGNPMDRATWAALLVMPQLVLPLYDRVLFAQIGTGLAFAPIQYQLKYRDTELMFANTRRLEWRAEVGLTVQVTPTFP